MTGAFPSEEKFGITSRIRRASVSIPSNIAEGATRNSSGEFRQYLYVAAGSASELDTLLGLCSESGYGDPEKLKSLISNLERVSRLIFGLIKSIETKIS